MDQLPNTIVIITTTTTYSLVGTHYVSDTTFKALCKSSFLFAQHNENILTLPLDEKTEVKRVVLLLTGEAWIPVLTIYQMPPNPARNTQIQREEKKKN